MFKCVSCPAGGAAGGGGEKAGAEDGSGARAPAAGEKAPLGGETDEGGAPQETGGAGGAHEGGKFTTINRRSGVVEYVLASLLLPLQGVDL